MKKALVTLYVGDPFPELFSITSVFMDTWARKIGAELLVISERVLTKDGDGKPLNYEKFQMQEISQHYDWTYFIDADAFIHPDTPDWVEMVNDKSVVLFNGVDNRLDRFAPSHYSRRSGSRIGACTWNVISSDWTGPDLWAPPSDFESAVKNITPIWAEASSGHCKREHLIDDYQLSDNIARYGLKVQTIGNILQQMGRSGQSYYEHLYNCDKYKKLQFIRHRLDEAGIAY